MKALRIARSACFVGTESSDKFGGVMNSSPRGRAIDMDIMIVGLSLAGLGCTNLLSSVSEYYDLVML